MNNERLPQDHPCVLNNFKKSFLDPPAAIGEPYQLDYPEVEDPSDGQARTVLHLLKNKVRMQHGSILDAVASITFVCDASRRQTGSLWSVARSTGKTFQTRCTWNASSTGPGCSSRLTWKRTRTCSDGSESRGPRKHASARILIRSR